MAGTEPRKPLIIKLYLPRSVKRGAPSDATDSRCEKRRKLDSAKPASKSQCCNTAYSYSGVGKSETDRCIVKENSRVGAKDSRIVSEERELKDTVDADSRGKKTVKVATTRTPCSTEYAAKSFLKENSRAGAKDSRTVSEESELKDTTVVDISRGKKMMKVATTTRTPCSSTEYPEKSFVEENSRADSRTGPEEFCKKEKKPREKNMLDRYKKMQCWVILKRMMIGRDGWALKQPPDLKALEILDKSEGLSKSTDLDNTETESNKLKKNTSETMLRRPIGLEDIESKLKKLLYSGPDEFADDIRLVFSHALLHPPRSEIHRIARRLSESFELSWKSLKEKWTHEERKGRKICKREVCPEVDERKTQKGGDFWDSHYWDPKRRSRSSNTDSSPSSQSQVWSRDCTSLKEHNMSISNSHLSPEQSSCTSMPKGSFCARD